MSNEQAAHAFNTTMHLIPCLDSISMALGCANYFQMWTIPWTARAHSVLSACMPHLTIIWRVIISKQTAEQSGMLDLASHVSHIVFTESGSFVVARIRDEINTYMCITREKNSVRYQHMKLPEFGPNSTLLSRKLTKDLENRQK